MNGGGAFSFVLVEGRIFLKMMKRDEHRYATMAVRAVRACAASGRCFPRVLLRHGRDQGRRFARHTPFITVRITEGRFTGRP